MAITTIQISKDLAKELQSRKLYNKESYEDIIWDLIEDTQQLTKETKKSIEKSKEDYKKGKTVTLSKVKKDLGL